jgi:hypothetical protein
MKRTIIAIALATFATAPAAAHGWTRSSQPTRSCADWKVQFDDVPALVDSESIDLPSSGRLDIDAAPNGGISVTRHAGSGYRVTLCKAVSQDLGSAALSEIRLVNSGRRLSVDSPGRHGWSAHFVVEAPAGAELGLEAHNGPIRVSDFEGTLEAETTNGPLGLSNVSGTISGRATNGPVSLERASGNVSVETKNGPLTVSVDELVWSGQGLEARTTNGPLRLEIPRGFSSPTEITTKGHNPWNCPEQLCGSLLREIELDRSRNRHSWNDEPRTLRIGTGSPVVRMSTQNGPVSVKEK